MALWSETNEELKDEIELEFKDELEFDNLVDVLFCEEMETNNEVAAFEEFLKASNDEDETLTVEEILRELVSDKASNDEEEILTEQLQSDKTEASNDEIAVETSDETKASNEKMNDEETCCREKKTETMGKIMVEEFYSQLNEEILDKEIKRGKEKLKKTREMRKERDKRWRGEQDKMERAAIKTIATLVPNLRGKRRTRLQVLEDVIHHFKMNNMMNDE